MGVLLLGYKLEKKVIHVCLIMFMAVLLDHSVGGLCALQVVDDVNTSLVPGEDDGHFVFMWDNLNSHEAGIV
eukprot:6904985-Ditylum_brightwellii.AAC.1